MIANAIIEPPAQLADLTARAVRTYTITTAQVLNIGRILHMAVFVHLCLQTGQVSRVRQASVYTLRSALHAERTSGKKMSCDVIIHTSLPAPPPSDHP